MNPEKSQSRFFNCNCCRQQFPRKRIPKTNQLTAQDLNYCQSCWESIIRELEQEVKEETSELHFYGYP